MFETCSRCLMPNTRPETPFKDGVCRACINFDTRKNVDWDRRIEELREICDKYRSNDGSWDCVIPVSSGKDSFTMTYWMKKVMRMNPLLVTVADPFTKTAAGLKNRRTLAEVFDCDQILFTISPRTARRLTRIGFEKYLNPLIFIEQAIKTVPIQIASKFGIPFHLRGEGPFIYGNAGVEVSSNSDYLRRDFEDYDIDFWCKHGANKRELNVLVPPKNFPDAYFMGYFIPWSSLSNQKIAKRYGFVDLTHEWLREGYIENFEQIDSIGYMVHLWLKYPKFGFQRISDIVSRRIREGAMTKQEGKRLILENDHLLDQRALDDFTSFLGYTTEEFWDIVEEFWNRDIFEKVGQVEWKMKVERF